MPWMPEVFTTTIADPRRSRAAAAGTNDAVPYYEGNMAKELDALVGSSASLQSVLDDPRAGRVESARGLNDFAAGTARCLRERDAVVEKAALTLAPLRTVEEVVVRILAEGGGRVELPVVGSERNPDRTLRAVRVYHSLWPLTGEHCMRPPLLLEDPSLHAEGVPGDYQRALWPRAI
jgi:hypothetical protein